MSQFQDVAEDIERFLRSAPHQPPVRTRQEWERRGFPFVTISRQAGAGGHRLAEKLLEAFNAEPDRDLFGGWQLFDQRLCEMIVRDPRLKVSIDHLLTEEYRSRADEFIRNLVTADTHQDIVMNKIFETIRMLAIIGKVIIVGRAGSQVTKGLGSGVSVRLMASEQDRVRRIMKIRGIDEKTARRSISRQDSGRQRLLRQHFGVDIDNPLLYDAIWNTSAVRAGSIADAIVALIKDRVRTT